MNKLFCKSELLEWTKTYLIVTLAAIWYLLDNVCGAKDKIYLPLL